MQDQIPTHNASNFVIILFYTKFLELQLSVFTVNLTEFLAAKKIFIKLLTCKLKVTSNDNNPCMI